MSNIPFYIVTLNHSNWDDALLYARSLPSNTMPELRIDLFPDVNPGEMVKSLEQKCILTCRRTIDGGNWRKNEDSRLQHILVGLKSAPAWIDIEDDVKIPTTFIDHIYHTKILRSHHSLDGTFDFQQRLLNLPQCDAFKWVGKSNRLTDNIKVREALKTVNNHTMPFSVFLIGNHGILSRCMQNAWGGSFTYCYPDNSKPVVSGQLSLMQMIHWGCDKIKPNCRLYGVIGDPIIHSLSPSYHNAKFQNLNKNLFYVPLQCSNYKEAKIAIDALEIFGLSVTSPLKETLPNYLNLSGPLNTLWRQEIGQVWHGINTDFFAIDSALKEVLPGPVLILGNGGVSKTVQQVLSKLKWPYLVLSRKTSLSYDFVRNFNPVGIIQATCLGMNIGDKIPFFDILKCIKSNISWGVEWVYKEDTAFSKWLKNNGSKLINGKMLFDIQASRQSDIFISNSDTFY